MKKRLLIIIIVCLLATTVIFFGLWQQEKNNQAEMTSLCQASAASATNFFSNYQANGVDSDYWHAVAEFRVFEQSYGMLAEGTNKQANYTFSNEVYGYLVLYPERSKKHIDEIIDVMAIIAKDVTDGAGFVRMADLRNNIKE